MNSYRFINKEINKQGVARFTTLILGSSFDKFLFSLYTGLLFAIPSKVIANKSDTMLLKYILVIILLFISIPIFSKLIEYCLKKIVLAVDVSWGQMIVRKFFDLSFVEASSYNVSNINGINLNNSLVFLMRSL